MRPMIAMSLRVLGGVQGGLHRWVGCSRISHRSLANRSAPKKPNKKLFWCRKPQSVAGTPNLWPAALGIVLRLGTQNPNSGPDLGSDLNHATPGAKCGKRMHKDVAAPDAKPPAPGLRRSGSCPRETLT